MEQRAIIERKPLWYGYWAILVLVAVVGLGFLGYRYAQGLRVTNMGSVVSWGLWISLYILFIGLSAGSFLLSTFIYVFNMTKYERIGRLALYSAVICLIMGLIFVLADLGHPERFWEVYTNLARTSILWYEVNFYGLYIVIIMAELFFLIRTDLVKIREHSTGLKRRVYRILALGSQRTDELSKKRDMKVVKVLGIIGIPTALAVHGGTGAVFAVVMAVPHWNTPLLPIVFITSALVSGAALLLFVRTFFFKPAADETQFLSGLSRLALGLLVVDWVMVFFDFLVILYGQVPAAAKPVTDMLFNSHWWIFWVVQMGIGLVVPVCLILLKGKSRVSLGLAGLAIVIGISAVRWNIILPGLSLPKIEGGLADSFFSPRLTTVYWPTTTELVSSLGLLAVFMLLISLGLKILPLQTVEHSEKPEGGR